jgi:hypothetical protein
MADYCVWWIAATLLVGLATAMAVVKATPAGRERPASS